MAISASAIKLGTTGAVVTSASSVAPTSTNPQYCAVIGYIAPFTAGDPKINFEVNLPASWNSKALEYGGGGYDGILTTGLGPLTAQLPSAGLPLQQGYVTFGSDSGHQTPQGGLATFALNTEALNNFAYAANDKVHDVAIALIQAYYDTSPTEIYFYGHSEGGREALAMAQMFPDDFNGIIALSPVINWTLLQLFGNSIGVAQFNGGWLNPTKVATLASAVVSACDSLDGLADGVVANYLACNSKVFNIQSLLCPGGGDTGNNCLSSQQIAEVNLIHGGYSINFPLANGISTYPGFMYGGESQSGGMTGLLMGTVPAAFPTPASSEGTIPWYGAEAIKYFITQNAQFNPQSFGTFKYQSQIDSVSALMDMTNPDLSGFYSSGGKLIMLEQTADYAQSPNEGINYYQSVVNALGAATAAQFMRLYISPGTTHDGGGLSLGGSPVPAAVDLLGALDTWVSKGTAPQQLVQYHESPTSPFAVIASRPLCLYAQYPKYNGTGSTLSASSYTCTGAVAGGQ